MKTRFVLIETSHAGNVGAAARAMKTMGFDDLVLVRPRWANVLRKEETIQRASGAWMCWTRPAWWTRWTKPWTASAICAPRP
jgi:tRNA C32,U32 (ribose-2'-O)-methylase TrmJ